MNVKLRFEGGKELAEALEQLSKRTSKKTMTEALKFGGDAIRSSAARQAPRRSPRPDMADHIVVATQRARGRETAAVSVGPAKDFHYARMQEFGTVHHAAQPFLRPAFDGKVSEALERIRQELWALLSAKGIRRFVSSPTTPSAPDGGDLL